MLGTVERSINYNMYKTRQDCSIHLIVLAEHDLFTFHSFNPLLKLLIQRTSMSLFTNPIVTLLSHLLLSRAFNSVDYPRICKTFWLLALVTPQYPGFLLLQWSVFAVSFLPLLLFITSTSVMCQDLLPDFFFQLPRQPNTIFMLMAPKFIYLVLTSRYIRLKWNSKSEIPQNNSDKKILHFSAPNLPLFKSSITQLRPPSFVQ